MELATQQLLHKNIRQHEVLKVGLYDSRFPPFLHTSDIITSENSKHEQKMKVLSLLQNNEYYNYIISTDGSTLRDENRCLGPSGAAAIIFHKTNMRQPVEVLTANLGLVSHNYEAELVGLQLALRYLQQRGINNSNILVVSDCIPAMEATFTNNITVDYKTIL